MSWNRIALSLAVAGLLGVVGCKHGSNEKQPNNVQEQVQDSKSAPLAPAETPKEEAKPDEAKPDEAKPDEAKPDEAKKDSEKEATPPGPSDQE
jgi:Tfp pilus assembly protein PilP